MLERNNTWYKDDGKLTKLFCPEGGGEGRGGGRGWKVVKGWKVVGGGGRGGRGWEVVGWGGMVGEGERWWKVGEKGMGEGGRR